MSDSNINYNSIRTIITKDIETIIFISGSISALTSDLSGRHHAVVVKIGLRQKLKIRESPVIGGVRMEGGLMESRDCLAAGEEDPILKCVAVRVKYWRNPAEPHFTAL